MPNTLYHKRSAVKDKTPSASTISYGEICINYNKDNEFIALKNSGNEVVKIKAHNMAADIGFDTDSHASTVFTGTTVENSLTNIEQSILDNEDVTGASLNDLNNRINALDVKAESIPTKFSELTNDLVTTATITNTTGTPTVKVKCTGSTMAFTFTNLKGEKGEDGTGISVKGASGDCQFDGDAYIVNDSTSALYGHIMIYNTASDSFIDGGVIKGEKGDKGDNGIDGASAGFGTITASASTLSAGSNATASVSASGNDSAKNFNFKFGIPRGNTGAAAGFGTPTATVTTLEPGSNANVTVTSSGSNTEKVFNFAFQIPKGEQGTGLNVKSSSGACSNDGDGYIDANGNLQIWNTAAQSFTNAGQIKGEKGDAAGFGEPTASATTVETGGSAWATVSASGTDTEKVFSFNFGIPKGEKGEDGADGADGSTPYIYDGYWHIGATNTYVKAEGKDGTGITVKASSADCTNVGDAYIGADGNIYFKNSDGGFTNGGAIKGDDGISVELQWSPDGSSWHDTYQNGDLYIHQRMSDDRDWSNPIKVVGEDGEKGAPGTDGASVQIQWSPDGSSWHDTYQNGDLYIHQKMSDDRDWSNPIKVVGEDGEKGAPGTDGASVQIQWSPDGSSWHDTYQNGDSYIHQKMSSASTYGNAIRVVGKDGNPAGFGIPVVGNVTKLESGENPTVEVNAAGPDTAKVFTFNFAIPKGEKGDTYLGTSTDIFDGSGTPTIWGVFNGCFNNVADETTISRSVTNNAPISIVGSSSTIGDTAHTLSCSVSLATKDIVDNATSNTTNLVTAGVLKQCLDETSSSSAGLSISPSTDKRYLVGTSGTGSTSDITELNVASGVYTEGTTVHAEGFYETSDERLKAFSDDVTVDFEKLKAVPKKHFTWKEGKNGNTQIGTSAQKVMELYPELVKQSDGILSVDYAKLSVIALAAIDKLYEKTKVIDTLTEKIEKLEKEINSLKKN